MTEKPNPGSAEAVDQGCTCPIIDNHYGKGIPHEGMRVFYVENECPLHGHPDFLAKNQNAEPLPHSEDDA